MNMFQMKIWKEYWNYWINRRISFELILFFRHKIYSGYQECFSKNMRIENSQKNRAKNKNKNKIKKIEQRESKIRRFFIVAMIFYFEKIKNIKRYPHIISELWISF